MALVLTGDGMSLADALVAAGIRGDLSLLLIKITAPTGRVVQARRAHR